MKPKYGIRLSDGTILFGDAIADGELFQRSGNEIDGTSPAGITVTEQLLHLEASVDLRSTGSTLLITAGGSETILVGRVDVNIQTWDDTSPFTDDPRVRIDGTGAGDIIADRELTGAGAGGSTDNAFVLRTNDRITKVTTGNSVSVLVTAAGGGTDLTADIYVWGVIL